MPECDCSAWHMDRRTRSQDGVTTYLVGKIRSFVKQTAEITARNEAVAFYLQLDIFCEYSNGQ